jgi:hypothetical protein
MTNSIYHNNVVLLKKTILFAFFLFLFSSCSITERRYRAGYYREWFNLKSSSKGVGANYTQFQEEELINSNPIIDSSDGKTSEKTSVLNDIKTSNFPSSSIKSAQLATAFTDSKINNDFAKIGGEKFLSKIKFKENTLQFNSPSKSNDATTKIIGVIILVLGLFVLLFASWLVGLILLIPAIFLIASKPKSSEVNNRESRYEKHDNRRYDDEQNRDNNYNSDRRDNGRNESELQEVVYLKNGGIVRGIIIEQIPNEQLKIQTRDGNVFVYKMTEVEKITKEYSK